MKYYDKTGREITRDQWSSSYHESYHESYKRVGSDTVSVDGIDAYVSTVWLGMDMGFGSADPLIFETVIFADGSDLDEFAQRYSTLTDAADTHNRIVDGLRHGIWPSEVNQ